MADILVVVDMQNDFITGALGSAEAQAVQTRLSAQNVGVYIHPFTQPELSLRAQGSADQVEAVVYGGTGR